MNIFSNTAFMQFYALIMLYFAVIIVLSNAEDSTKLVMEAERQGLMNGEYVFLLVQQFEVSGNVVSNLQEKESNSVNLYLYNV